MYNIVFVVIAAIFLAVPSIYAMEVAVESQHTISSLQKLCVRFVVDTIQSPTDSDGLVKGITKYSELSEDIRYKIEKKLPGRHRRQCRIQKSCNVKKVIFNEKLQKCMILSDGIIYLANGRTGDIIHSFDAPEAIDILLSPDGNKYFIQCKDTYFNNQYYGDVYDYKRNDKKHQLVRNRIDQCFSASFSPTGDGLIVQQPTGLSLWDINSHVKIYDGCQQIKFCSAGERLLVKKNNVARVVDTTNDKELLQAPETIWAFMSSNGKKLFRQKGSLVTGPLLLLSELIDIDSGVIVPIPTGEKSSIFDPFSADGNYLLVSYDNKYDLWDTQLSQKKVSLAIGTMLPAFVLGGKYLFIKTPQDEYQIKKYGCVVSVNELIAYVAENEKDKVNIADVPKKTENHDCHNLLFPLLGNYVVHHLSEEVWLIDLLNNTSVLFTKIKDQVAFSVFGRMLLLKQNSEDGKQFVDIIRFDNDLTIEQFLLKKYIVHGMTIERVTSHIHLCKVYNSLSSKQKSYFAEHVFK